MFIEWHRIPKITCFFFFSHNPICKFLGCFFFFLPSVQVRVNYLDLWKFPLVLSKASLSDLKMHVRGKKAHTGKWSASHWVYYSYMMWCKSATRETLLFDPLRVPTIKRCSSRLTLFANLLWVIGIFSRANCLYTRTSTCDKNSLPAAQGFDVYA